MLLKYILLVGLVVFFGYSIYALAMIVKAKRVARGIIEQSRAFTLEDPARTKRVLVLGDSTAVGVGATPETSIARRLAQHFNASVENYAVSGAVTSDLVSQFSRTQHEHYDLVEIQIGANDVMSVRSLPGVARTLEEVLPAISKKTDRIVLLTAGDIGKAPVFVWPLSSFISYRTRELRALFMDVCARSGVSYVDIYSAPDIFPSDPQRYYAPDGLHLAGEGYGYWWELLMRVTG